MLLLRISIVQPQTELFTVPFDPVSALLMAVVWDTRPKIQGGKAWPWLYRPDPGAQELQLHLFLHWCIEFRFSLMLSIALETSSEFACTVTGS